MSRTNPRRSLEVLAREADALRRQSVLLPRKLMPRHVALPHRGDEVDVVFLIHGVMATAGVFAPIEDRLRRSGVEHIGSFSYLPFRSVGSLTAELRAALRHLPARARLHLVGHSLGGVVARHYVQEGGGERHVYQTISLASPFHGTGVVSFLPRPVASLSPLSHELSPSSSLLSRLRDPSLSARHVPHTSFVAAGDVLVPPASAAFVHGDVHVVEGVGHNALLFHDGVAEQVARLIVGDRRVAAE